MKYEKIRIITVGDGLIKQLSSDLQQKFPDMKGFSISNTKHIDRLYLFYY